MPLSERKPTANKHFYFYTTLPHVVRAKCKNLSAICKSRDEVNDENAGNQGRNDGNAGNQDVNTGNLGWE